MTYYSIQHSLDVSIMGHYPQVKEVLYHCDIWNDPRFIGKFPFQEIKIPPIIANPILHPKSELTDLIYLWDVGFSFTLLVSSKLKNILEEQRKSGVQYIQCSVFQNGIEYQDYWLLNMFETDNDFIEFSKSKISVDEQKVGGGTIKKEVIGINSLHDFDKLIEKHREKMEVVNIDNPSLKPSITSNFFLLKYPVKYVVSGSLKNQIESAGCTGIEFMPVELSLNEWLQQGNRNAIYGKNT